MLLVDEFNNKYVHARFAFEKLKLTFNQSYSMF